MKSFLIMAVLPAVAFGCTAGVTRAHAPTMAMVPDTSSTPPDSAPVVVASTPVPSSTSSPAPFAPFTVTTWADNVLLRGNPGYLFPQLAVLQQGTPLLVLGRSPGGEWLLCQTSENRVGWVFTQLVDNPAGDAGEAPSIWPPSVQALVGTVTDPAGMPISGIQFSVVQGPEGDAQRNDAVTDDSGTFYAFMPSDASGTWSVGYTAVSCTSNTMDANCDCIGGVCGRPHPEGTSVAFPRSQDEVLRFTWR